MTRTSEWRLSLEVSPYEYVVTCLRDRIHELVISTSGVTPIDWGGGCGVGDWAGAEIYEEFRADAPAAELVKIRIEQLAMREALLREVDPEDALLSHDEAQELVMARLRTNPELESILLKIQSAPTR